MRRNEQEAIAKQKSDKKVNNGHPSSATYSFETAPTWKDRIKRVLHALFRKGNQSHSKFPKYRFHRSLNTTKESTRACKEGVQVRNESPSKDLVRFPCLWEDYEVGEVIKVGGYGEIRAGFHKMTLLPVVIKSEKNGTRSTLNIEREVYNQLAAANLHGFPKMLFWGAEHGKHFLILERLGKSLMSYLRANPLLSISCIASISIKILERLESLHSIGIIHRDLSPNNVMFGRKVNGNDDKVFLIDFGNSSRFRTAEGAHIGTEYFGTVAGTRTFSPCSWHKCNAQSRRDDLESLTYIMAYMFFGVLPWDKEDVEDVLKSKVMTTSEFLFKGMPKPFVIFHEKVQDLEFADCPNYDLLKTIMSKLVE